MFDCTHRASTLLELHEVIHEDGHGFDNANTSHALSRLAKLHRGYTSQLRRAAMQEQADQAFEELVLPSLVLLNRLAIRNMEDYEAWDVSLSLWAYSTLDFYDRQLFDLLCSRAQVVAPYMRPPDCASILVAFGRFGHYHPEVLKSIPQVRRGLGSHAARMQQQAQVASTGTWGSRSTCCRKDGRACALLHMGLPRHTSLPACMLVTGSAITTCRQAACIH